jgi:SulP family sulfate permease
VALGPIVGVIPMAALAAVMVFVAISTFDWHSLRTLRRMPRSENAVMLVTVAVVVATSNPAIGAGVGVLDAIQHKYATRGKTVAITGLTDVTGHYHQRLAGRLGGGE